MNNDGVWFFIFLIVVTICLCYSCNNDRDRQLRDKNFDTLQQEVVDRGYAERITSGAQNKVLRWKADPCSKK